MARGVMKPRSGVEWREAEICYEVMCTEAERRVGLRWFEAKARNDVRCYDVKPSIEVRWSAMA